MPRARVLPYSPAAFCELLAAAPGNTVASIRSKLHAVYFEEYFAKLSARTIVVEADYVDHDFLEDFAAYYVRCFQSYSRHCSRLHFFNETFDQETFLRLFDDHEGIRETLQRSYLGFLVVRPLPQRVVGRTCLATYPLEEGREFPTARPYEANLFGLALQVQTIAFQEQDRAVAACATSALWSVFHGTGFRFHHRIPSPAEITKRATASNPLETRAFPAGDGLMFVQMADAVRSCELEPLWFSYTEPYFLRATIYAYLNGGISLLLNGDIHPRGNLDEGSELGVHAVAITGYQRSNTPAAPESDGFRLASSRMTKLYCHDDGVGPFARMVFEDANGEDRAVLSTSQAASNAEIGSRVFLPNAILVSLYHKIRVPFLRIHQEIRAFDNYLVALDLESKAIPGEEVGLLASTLEWDIRLITVNDYKTDCLTRANIERRQAVLESALPRYLWLARALHDDGTGFDLLFDATGLELSNLCLGWTGLGSRIIPLLNELRRAGTVLQFPECEGVLETLSRE